MFKLLVCGSRTFPYDKIDLIRQEIFKVVGHSRDVMIIHGDALGADRMAGQIGRENGFAVVIVPAQWEVYGKRAGSLRNSWMLELKPDMVLAFKDKDVSIGTEDMIRKTEAAEIPIRIILAYN